MVPDFESVDPEVLLFNKDNWIQVCRIISLPNLVWPQEWNTYFYPLAEYCESM